MTVISIQSQVVHGKVGNSAAVPVLQAHGLTVAPVPTTLLSNHPHYPTMRGEVLPARLVTDLLQGVEERGLVDSAAALVTGYLGSTEIGEVVADFVARAKDRRSALLYICDPVCGDDDLGMFVDSGLKRLFLKRLLPLADIATPNAWELRTLMDTPDLLAAGRALQEFGPRQIVVTGGDAHASELTTLVFAGERVSRIVTDRLPARPAGTGDLFTAVLTAQLATGHALEGAVAHAVAATYDVLQRTAPLTWSEMPIETMLPQIVHPHRRFMPETVHV